MTTPSALLADLDTQGIRLHLEGDRLRVDAPKGMLTPELHQTLAEHKADILEALHKRREGRSPFNWGARSYEEVMTLSAEEFRRAAIAVVIHSELVGEEVILASNGDVMARLEGDGRAVYLPDEIEALEGLGEEEILRLHASKKILGGRILPLADRSGGGL